MPKYIKVHNPSKNQKAKPKPTKVKKCKACNK